MESFHNIYNEILKEAVSVMDFDSWDKDVDQNFKDEILYKVSGYPIILNLDNPKHSVISPKLFFDLYKSIDRNIDLFDMYTEEVLRQTDEWDKEGIDWTYDRLGEVIPLILSSKIYYISSKPLDWKDTMLKFSELLNMGKKDLEYIGGYFTYPYDLISSFDSNIIWPKYTGSVLNTDLPLPLVKILILNVLKSSVFFIKNIYFAHDYVPFSNNLKVVLEWWTNEFMSIELDGREYCTWWNYLEDRLGSMNNYFDDDIYKSIGICNYDSVMLSTIKFCKRYSKMIGQGI